MLLHAYKFMTFISSWPSRSFLAMKYPSLAIFIFFNLNSVLSDTVITVLAFLLILVWCLFKNVWIFNCYLF